MLPYHISTASVSMLTSSAVVRGVKPLSGQTKDKKMVFATFPLSMQYTGVRAKTVFFRIRFMSPSEATCLLDDSFSELALSRSN